MLPFPCVVSRETYHVYFSNNMRTISKFTAFGTWISFLRSSLHFLSFPYSYSKDLYSNRIDYNADTLVYIPPVGQPFCEYLFLPLSPFLFLGERVARWNRSSRTDTTLVCIPMVDILLIFLSFSLFRSVVRLIRTCQAKRVHRRVQVRLSLYISVVCAFTCLFVGSEHVSSRRYRCFPCGWLNLHSYSRLISMVNPLPWGLHGSASSKEISRSFVRPW